MKQYRCLAANCRLEFTGIASNGEDLTFCVLCGSPVEILHSYGVDHIFDKDKLGGGAGKDSAPLKWWVKPYSEEKETNWDEELKLLPRRPYET